LSKKPGFFLLAMEFNKKNRLNAFRFLRKLIG
jgi:hypothetical protein